MKDKSSKHTQSNLSSLDSRLVHKIRQENVLISYLHRPLPHRIESALLDSLMNGASERDRSAYQLIFKYYRKDPALLTGKTESDEYYLVNMPLQFPVAEMKKRMKAKNLTFDQMKFILSLYKKDRPGGVFHLIRDPEEREAEYFSSLIDLHPYSIPVKDKEKLSEIFESLNFPTEEDRFHAAVFINTNHPFFFEHRMEHVPGMMLLEAARQMLEACSHKYGGVPFKGYNFVVTQITIEFFRFAELYLPVTLEAVITDKLLYNSGVWADLVATVTAYQANRKASVMTFHWNIVTERVFERMRGSKPGFGSHPWFLLKENIECQIMVRLSEETKISAELEFFNFEELILKLPMSASSFRSMIKSDAEIFAYFAQIGFVHGRATLEIMSDFGDFILVYVHFVEIGKLDKKNLHEAIKQYGYLVENWSNP